MFTLNLENEKNVIVDINDGVNYVVTSVTGLNPPSASIYTSQSPNRKGVKYNGSNLNERNVGITVKLLGDVETNRNALYEWCDPEQYVKIRYSNGIKNVYCEGHVEECEIDYFTNNELVNLSIICEDPYWKDLLSIITDISNIVKHFSFDFSISKPIPFSSMKDDNTTRIFNAGAESGVIITIIALEDIENITLYDGEDPSKMIQINTTLRKNEKVIIDTESSPKHIKRYKVDGSSENILKYTNRNLTWFTLKKGNNSFRYTIEDGKENNAVVTFKFTTKYLGV